jgi:hypothetical protein
MSGVVLRCPHCGTAQPAGGECEACHEAQVRYFCTNHNPGVWTESGTCPQCGARFGDPAPVRQVSPVPPPRTYAPPPALEPRHSRRRADPDSGPWGGEGRFEGPFDTPSLGDAPPDRPDPSRLLLAILGAASRARKSRADAYSDDYSPRRSSGGGCIGRLFMLALLLIALFLMVPIFLGALLGLG